MKQQMYNLHIEIPSILLYFLNWLLHALFS